MGTLLVDVCNFENFKSEYIKLAIAKKIKSNSDNEEAIYDESIPKINNNNKVSKISDISVLNQRIAKNVTELKKKLALVTPHFFQPLLSQQSFQQLPLQPSQQPSSQLSSQQTIPSIAEFLHQIDEIEKTEDYYFKFLEEFKKQRIKVKHLNKLNDA
ncbi:hypothetical protein C1645_813882 [Glomus cerebriforme]|uniref:Uncharacterized protein n=1 Tax=Glomus cerebriforme TaxID=658196 RepID=A0A397THB5_9GLOM|nr:hypothetical protein C1645_813882 [Glomus cerebriforme]